jgi:hypothetical protein
MAMAMTSGTARATLASHHGVVAPRQASSASAMRKGTNALVRQADFHAERRPRDAAMTVTMMATVPSSSAKGVGRTRPTSDPAAPNFIPIPAFEECFPSSTKETTYVFLFLIPIRLSQCMLRHTLFLSLSRRRFKDASPVS